MSDIPSSYDIEEILNEVWDTIENDNSWLYYAEQLYFRDEYFVYKLVEDHYVENTFMQMLYAKEGNDKAEYIKKEPKTQSTIRRLIEHLKSKYQKNIDYVKERNDPYLIGFRNGYVDIKRFKETGKLELEHYTFLESKPEPTYFFEQIPHIIDDQILKEIKDKNLTPEQILSKYAPNIYKFFNDIVGSEYILLQITKIGYCFYRANPFKTIFMEIGDKNSGKSTFLGLIRKVLGDDNISAITLQDLANKDFSIINLYHKLANIRADLPYSAIKQTGSIKELSGEDLVSANRKFKEPLNFINYAKGIFSTNKLPKLNDITDEAFLDRFIPTKYPNHFEKSVDFAQKLYDNKEDIEGLIIASLYALMDLLKNGFSAYTNGIGISELWKRQNSTIYNFVRTFNENGLLLFADKLQTPTEDLYNAYTTFCDNDLGERAEIKKTFTEELEMLFHIQIERPRIGGKQIKSYKGIGLLSEPQNSVNPQQDLLKEQKEGSGRGES